MAKYFNIPWANAGDKTTIPDTVQPDGSFSYPSGWGGNYELEQGVDPNALDVSRTAENTLKFQVTEFEKEAFEEGILTYDALVDYALLGVTRGSNGKLFQALVINGPTTSVVNPVTDDGTTWQLFEANIWAYDAATEQYLVSDYVVGSDGQLYECKTANGVGDVAGVRVPNADASSTYWQAIRADLWTWDTAVNYPIGAYVKASTGETYTAVVITGPNTANATDPVSDTTGAVWKALGMDVRDYSATPNYPISSYVKGSDFELYVALIANGPGTSVVNPVGDLTATWEILTGSGGKITLVFASDAAFVLDAKTRAARFTCTAGGGGGGGASATVTGSDRGGNGGGAGGTTIQTIYHPFQASYALVVGVGGAGGVAAATPNPGSSGLASSVNAADIILNSGGGGGGAAADSVSPGRTSPASIGGTATSGILNLEGGAGGQMLLIPVVGGDDVVVIAPKGSSFWGADASPQQIGVDGDDGQNHGNGGQGAVTSSIQQLAGGDGANGIVLVEEFF